MYYQTTNLRTLGARVKSVILQTMLPPSSSSSSNAAVTYTTIPISGADVVSRSVQNLSAALSRHPPWSDLTSSLSPPDSLSSAITRLQINSKHFAVNYGILIAASAALFLLVSNPFAMIVYALVSLAWLVAYFFREDPMVVYGRHVDDRVVLLGLSLGTILLVWLIGMVNTLAIGISVGVLISAVHGMFRDTDGLFLDEDAAASNGLIASGSHRKGFPV